MLYICYCRGYAYPSPSRDACRPCKPIPLGDYDASPLLGDATQVVAGAVTQALRVDESEALELASAAVYAKLPSDEVGYLVVSLRTLAVVELHYDPLSGSWRGRWRWRPSEKLVWPGWEWLWEHLWRRRVEKLRSEATSWLKGLLGEGRRLVLRLSGGKDSTAAAVVYADAGGLDAIYSDTGWEFEATRETAGRVARKLGLNLLVASPWRSGDELLSIYGPPGRDYRWCTQLLKVGPADRLAVELGADTSVTGMRASESPSRRATPRLAPPRGAARTWVASPIREWSSLDVYTLIHAEGLPLNPLYQLGYDRVGCVNCPSQSVVEMEIAARVEPTKWRKWMRLLEEYASGRGLPSEWLAYHLWRWRIRPPRFAKRLVEWREVLRATAVTKVLRATPSSVELELPVEGELSVAAKVLGAARVSSSLEGAGWRARVNGRRLTVAVDDEQELLVAVEKLARALVASKLCTGCPVCTTACPASAAKPTPSGLRVTRSCIGCSRCIQACPAASYALLSQEVGLAKTINLARTMS